MSENELFAVVQQVNGLYGSLFAQIISINFAMIVATWYFLHRARLSFRLAAFAFYLLGMLTLIGMMLQQANIKHRATAALTAIPDGQRSQFVSDYLAVQGGWLFQLTALFQNASLWALIGVTAYLLFRWRGESTGSSLPND